MPHAIRPCPYCALAADEGDAACGLHNGEPTVVPADAVRAPAVCRLAGISYRQLDYWTTTGLVRASYSAANGSGTQRLYSPDDVTTVTTIAALRRFGLSLAMIRRLDEEGRATVLAALYGALDGPATEEAR